MTVQCYTSIALNYIAKARVLAWSLKRFHPDWVMTVCITDREPPGFVFDLEQEPFDRVIWAHDLPIDRFHSWLFQHDVVEACTAVKGPVMKLLAEQADADAVVYLDPDIAVFATLSPLLGLLDEYSILLTPHQLSPDYEDRAIRDNELTSLRLGAYNLGFVAIRNDDNGKAFANWWHDRLLDYCYDQPERGIFVDQKWGDLVPAMFDGVEIIRDPGYNVASWNLSHRRVRITRGGEILVGDSLLRFFHFTKLGVVGDRFTQRYAKDNTDVYELWSWYRRMIERFSAPGVAEDWWHYGEYSNGVPVTAEHRHQYRESVALQEKFEDPFLAGPGSFYSSLIAKGLVSPGLSRSSSYGAGRTLKQSRFLILSEPRTGSNNLSYCLDAHPDLKVGNELLHPRNGVRGIDYGVEEIQPGESNGASYHWVTRADPDTRDSVIHDLFERHNGFKIHTTHIPVDLIVDIARQYNCTLLLTRRSSLFEQALSNYIAVARNRWHMDENPENSITPAPFEIPTGDFLGWIEWLLQARRQLWARLKVLQDKVVLIEYESFYNGSFADRVSNVDYLYGLMGLRNIGALDEASCREMGAKFSHYLSRDKQKMTDQDTINRLVTNSEQLRVSYAQWMMSSHGKFAVV